MQGEDQPSLLLSFHTEPKQETLDSDCDSGAQCSLVDSEMTSVKLEDCSQKLGLDANFKNEEEEVKIGDLINHDDEVPPRQTRIDDSDGGPPTLNVALIRAMGEIELLKGKIQTLEEKVHSLTNERDFLRANLEMALSVKVGAASGVSGGRSRAVSARKSTRPTGMTDSSDTSSSSESSDQRKKRGKRKQKKKHGKGNRVTGPEHAVARYRKVVAEVARGRSMSRAFEKVGVDRNTIVCSAPIAELALVDPNTYKNLIKGFKPGDKLSDFVDKCKNVCQAEEIANIINEKKKEGSLLRIYKRNKVQHRFITASQPPKSMWTYNV
ncbi:hypothetical protein UPYG_G00160050 [Umbra pygmaea]|uniref:Coiled-coil domain-containing protein 106-like n=1 Tax=Umbra pygmaea TaxID=75934 RepID=A0ABD0WZ19_UMBPY